MHKLPLETPLNAHERFLHAVAVRLDVIIEQNNSIIDFIAKQNNIPVTNAKSTTAIPEVKTKTSTRKSTTSKK